METHILTSIIFSPIIGALLILCVPKESSLARYVALLFAAVPLALTIFLLTKFNAGFGGAQFSVQYAWISSINTEVYFGIDGLNILSVLLTVLLSFVCILASWNVSAPAKGYFSLFLLMEASLLGVFLSLDFFLFYLFFGMSLIPAYFLIGVWGGSNRVHAATRFMIFFISASALILVPMILFYIHSTPHTFNLISLAQQGISGEGATLLGFSFSFETFRQIIFLFLLVGFGIVIPIFPLHGWLGDAHTEAPCQVSSVLAAIFLNIGCYGLIRIGFPILAAETSQFAPWLIVIGTVNILYGAFATMGQLFLSEDKGGNDIKRVAVYSSMSQMGIVVFGMGVLTAETVRGAVLHMFGRGIVVGMLFLLIGMLCGRTNDRRISSFGGLAYKVPRLTFFFAIAVLASFGFPGSANFISEYIIVSASLSAHKILTLFVGVGIVVVAVSMFLLFKKIFLGALAQAVTDIKDINIREFVLLLPLLLIVLFLGLYPQPAIDFITETVNQLIATMKV